MQCTRLPSPEEEMRVSPPHSTVLVEEPTSTRTLHYQRFEGTPERVELIPDCLEHIFNYLSTRDKGRVTQVCHLWRDVCYRHSIWKNEVASIRLSYTNKDILHSIRSRGIKKFRIREHRSNLELVTRTFDTIISLDLSGCYYTTDEAMERAFTSTRDFNELENLNLNYCSNLTEQGVCFALSKMPNLRKLSLRGCRGVRFSLEKVKNCVRTSCKSLETLSIAGCKQMGVEDLTGVLDRMQNLRELDLEDCDHIHDECLQCIAASNLNQLRVLNLSFCVSIFDAGLVSMADTLPNLSKLLLRSVDNITSLGVSVILQRCSRLKILDLAHCDWLSDNSIEDIVTGRLNPPRAQSLRRPGDGAVSSLEELDLSCAKISDEGVRLISENMPGLKHLKIGQCLKLTDLSVTHIASNLVNLVTIDAYGCKFSTPAINGIWDSLPCLNRINLFMFL